MIVDTSAFVAILYREPEAQPFVERIERSRCCGGAGGGRMV
jgi:uncharacterized protein with PIN domain